MESRLRLKAAIEELAMSQSAFAEAIHLSRSGLSGILSGRTQLQATTALAIEYVHGVSANWLLKGELPKFVAPSVKLPLLDKMRIQFFDEMAGQNGIIPPLVNHLFNTAIEHEKKATLATKLQPLKRQQELLDQIHQESKQLRSLRIDTQTDIFCARDGFEAFPIIEALCEWLYLGEPWEKALLASQSCEQFGKMADKSGIDRIHEIYKGLLDRVATSLELFQGNWPQTYFVAMLSIEHSEDYLWNLVEDVVWKSRAKQFFDGQMEQSEIRYLVREHQSAGE